MRYTVRDGPRHGRLTVADGGRIRAFSQVDVDAELVAYEHTQRGQFADSFRFDVSCGTERRRGLDFGLDVVPATIPVEVTGNLTVAYAGGVTLTSSMLRVTRQQFEVRRQLYFQTKAWRDNTHVLFTNTR